MYHLSLRGRVYQFRMRIPRDLQIHYGKEDISHTLRTTDRSRAKVLAALRTAEVEAEFANYQTGIPKQDDKPRELTPELITAICSQWESHNLFHDDKDREAGFEYGEIGEEIEERLERLREYEEFLRMTVGRGEHKIVEPALRDRVVLYSDGLNEAGNAAREMFGMERIIAAAESAASNKAILRHY